MLFMRFFVTAVLVVGTFILACERKIIEIQPAGSPQKQEQSSPQEQVDEGNEKFNQAWEVIGELEQDYQISINLLEFERRKSIPHVAPSPSSYNWRRLTRARRLAAKQKLAEFVTLAARILEIDTQKNVYIVAEDKAKVQTTLLTVMAYQESLRAFETQRGENYEPKSEFLNEPPYKKELDALKPSKAEKKSV